MDFPQSIQQNPPSSRVFVGVFSSKAEKLQRIVPSLKTRGNLQNGVLQQVTASKVLETITSLPRAAEPATNGLTETGPGRPTIAPRTNQARDVPTLQNPGKLTDSPARERGSLRMIRPPFESASQGIFDFKIGINFFKEPSYSRLHLQNMSVSEGDGVVGDGHNIVPGTFERHDVR